MRYIGISGLTWQYLGGRPEDSERAREAIAHPLRVGPLRAREMEGHCRCGRAILVCLRLTTSPTTPCEEDGVCEGDGF